MFATKVTAKVVQDSSGVVTEIPVVLTDEGVLESVADYIQSLQLNGVALSTLNKHIQSIILLIEFMDANEDMFNNAAEMFSTFVRRLYSGTVGDNGLDPSGLYWIPASIGVVSSHISHLTNFTDWMAEERLGKQINSHRKPSCHEERIQYAAWFRRNQNDFLGHIKDKSFNSTVKRARSIKGRTSLTRIDDDAIAFPISQFDGFYLHGLGGATDPRVKLRDKLILLLMHGAGFRRSEALLLWVTDVFEDPNDSECAIVRIYNEVEGKAPEGWKSRNGISTRKAYLRERFTRSPRAETHGTEHLGWKAKIADHRDGYLEAFWFPRTFGQVFKSLWRQYLIFRASATCHHPYAFISFDPRYLGRPYTFNAFNQNYAAGLRRIGLWPSKSEGLDPHGHRHNYGRRLQKAGLSSLVIKKCMHHKNINSQLRYTLPSTADVSQALAAASVQLDLNSDSCNSGQSFDWRMLTEHGFGDIDPDGNFTGNHPRFGQN